MEPDSSGDYQYDEAHDAVSQASGEDSAASADSSEQVPPRATMPSAQPDGDYSYDMAHDAVRPPVQE